MAGELNRLIHEERLRKAIGDEIRSNLDNEPVTVEHVLRKMFVEVYLQNHPKGDVWIEEIHDNRRPSNPNDQPV